jgi:DNA-binding NarL/FixJ family response regulator
MANESNEATPDGSESTRDIVVVSRSGTSAGVHSDTEPNNIAPLIVPTAQPTTVIIEPRTLIRDCLAKCIKGLKNDEIVCAYASVSDWLQNDSVAHGTTLVLLCTGGRRLADVEQQTSVLSRFYPAILMVLLSEDEDVANILGALDKGARGFIPTSLSLEVVIEAMQLIRAGGTFVPASSLLASRNAIADTVSEKTGRTSLFTPRQAAVVNALRQGKSNKVIAYEINMRESTVKVHVRNIMKKLNARNRTEVAFRVNAMATKGENV